MNYNVTSAGSLDSALNKADAVVDERRSNMKKRMAMTLAALALSVIMAVPAYAGTWKYVNDQWKYQRGANKFAYNEWVKDNGNWYYLDKDGYMKTGWQQINGRISCFPTGQWRSIQQLTDARSARTAYGFRQRDR